jgi:hypothetical protein
MGLYKNGVKLGQPYKNGVKMNAYRNGVKMFNDGPPPPPPPPPPPTTDFFGMLVNSGGDSQFILPLKYGNGTAHHDLTIWWGDGQVQEITGTAGITENDQGLTHSYPAANKDYEIKITGTTYLGSMDNYGSYFGLGFSASGPGFSNQNNKVKLKGLLGSPEFLVTPSMTSKAYCYYSMFYSCTGLTEIPANLLPATTLANYCYYSMFSGCTGLTEIPANLLPATTLALYCYGSMFYSCTDLTEIPANLLPVTTLADYCYYGMFSGCTGLTEIPVNLLPATTLANYCYRAMFSGCTGLTFIYMNPDWFTVRSAQTQMFRNCANITANTPYASIPSGWK